MESSNIPMAYFDIKNKMKLNKNLLTIRLPVCINMLFPKGHFWLQTKSGTWSCWEIYTCKICINITYTICNTFTYWCSSWTQCVNTSHILSLLWSQNSSDENVCPFIAELCKSKLWIPVHIKCSWVSLKKIFTSISLLTSTLPKIK